jgi:class 3 adenylate cyclase
MATDMRNAVGQLALGWRERGYDLGFGIGIAHGFATLGCVGFEGRLQYSVTGSVANLASRLCGEARDGQILIDGRVRTDVENIAELEFIGDLVLKGFRRAVSTFNVRSLVASRSIQSD